MASEDHYESVEMDENKGTNFQRRALPLPSPPPPKTIRAVTIPFLAFLVILLATSLIAVVTLYFQKQKMLQELEGAAQKYNTCYASLEESKGNFLRLNSDYWKFYDGSIYFFSEESKPWQEAEKGCVLHGAHLTSITSEQEMEYLFREGGRKTFWIGLSDLKKDSKWTWADGTEYNSQISFWDEGESGSGYDTAERQAHCVTVNIADSEYKWNAASCQSPYQWICKKTSSAKK